jgi:formylglycine-generating enzyme required for sulfatase activity
MSGNLWEWTRSVPKDYPYVRDEEKAEELDQPARILRGGCFDNLFGSVRCAVRLKLGPPDWFWDLGFRFVILPSSDL